MIIGYHKTITEYHSILEPSFFSEIYAALVNDKDYKECKFCHLNR